MDTLISETINAGSKMDDLLKLKSIGLSYLEKNDFTEAVKVYKKILFDYPEDVESYLLLGDLYLANEDFLSAEKLYQKALSLEPDNAVIQRRVKLSSLELTSHPVEEVPTDASSVTKLLQELTGRHDPVTEEELQKAASMLNEIVHAQNPAEIVAQRLDQIDSLIPALIELNIRQAKNDRRFDIVNLLQALQESIYQLVCESLNQTNLSGGAVETNQHKSINNKKIEFLVPDPDSITARIQNLIQASKESGCLFSINYDDQNNNDFQPDLVIASNPHINQAMMEKLALYSARHIPIVLDLDDDFEYMPINHPEYITSGLGTLEKSRSYNAALIFANLITVPGQSMAAHIRESGHRVEIMPFGWSKENEQWLKPISKRSTVNIGLIGIQGNFEDVQQYRRIIIRVMREFPQTRLVVCGDSIAYKLFENIAENRRVFLPDVPDEDMPYILGQIDILLIPRNVTPYHLVTTDKILLQAGIKGIPWIASPMPDFIQWQAGGITTDNPDEWHSYLRQFIQDQELRTSLGLTGRNQSEHRENEIIRSRWVNLIDSLLQSAQSK